MRDTPGHAQPACTADKAEGAPARPLRPLPHDRPPDEALPRIARRQGGTAGVAQPPEASLAAGQQAHDGAGAQTHPAPQRVHQLLAPWLLRQPDAPALRDAFVALRYGELGAQVEGTARQLQDAGVRAGDRVLIVGENCVALCVLFLALSRIDAWAVVVNARLSAREIDQFIAHSGARRALYLRHVSPDAAAHAERHGATPFGGALDAAAATGAAGETSAAGAARTAGAQGAQGAPGALGALGDIAIGPLADAALPEPCHADPRAQVEALVYTSGTTGAPKGVMLTHANLRFVAEAARDIRRLGPGDVLYGVLPMAHVVGLSTQFLGAMCAGAELLLVPQFSAERAVDALRRERVTVFTGVPALYARILEWTRQRGEPIDAPALRLISVAGSPLTPPLKADVERAFGLPLQNGYGLTETAPTVAQTRQEAPREDCSVGPALPQVELRLVDAAGRDVAPGEVGELWVRSPGVMRGYYRNAELTAAVLDAAGWFNTGDMARVAADGALFITGRSKELIIRSGFNVYPLEIEQVLNAYPGVVQSAVVGREAGHNEEIVAFLETRHGMVIDEAQLRVYLRDQLSPYKQPGEIRMMAALPSAPNGKVLKNVLKEQARTPMG